MRTESGPGRNLSTKQKLAIILVAGAVLRLALAPFFSFNIDLTYWMKVFNLIDGGYNLYGMDGYYYAPVWGYVLGSMDMLAHLLGITDYGTLVPEMYPYVDQDYVISEYVTSVRFNFIVKIPLILTDMAIGWLLFSFVRRITGNERKALIACLLWMFCPLTVLESSVHAMFDNISALFTLMAFIAAYDRKYVLSGCVYSLAVLTKFFPIFFVFFLVAMVFRNEGIHLKAFAKCATAIASSFVTMIVIEIPAIIKGQFWDSLQFLLSRIGLSASFMDSIMGPLAYVLVAFAVVALCWFVYYLCRIRPDIIRNAFLDISDEERERRVRKMGLIAAIVVTVLILVYSVLMAVLEGSFDLVSAFEMFGKRIVLLLSAYTMILEAYVAYRFLYSKETGDKPLMTGFMLSAALIFLWPPAPQYVVVILPALILYAVTVRDRFVRPFIFLTSAMALYDIVLAGPTTIMSLAVYTDVISLSTIIPMVEAITSYIGPIPVIAPFMAVFGGLAYVSLLNILYYWYTHRRVADES